MKKSALSILAGLILATSIQANACNRSSDQLICPGDTVVSSDNIVGTVMGVNPFKSDVTFKSDDYSIVYTRRTSSLALGKGCLEMYCVGDTVVSEDNHVGSIIGVNPYESTIAFKSHDYNIVYTRRLKSLSLDVGCVRGICVGDTVISGDNIEGIVLAVNQYLGEVAFKSTDYSIVYTREADSLSSAKYCNSYGQYARTQNSYPLIDENAYDDFNFKFSRTRPRLK